MVFQLILISVFFSSFFFLIKKRGVTFKSFKVTHRLLCVIVVEESTKGGARGQRQCVRLLISAKRCLDASQYQLVPAGGRVDS